MIERAAQIRIRAEAKAGEMLRAQENAKGLSRIRKKPTKWCGRIAQPHLQQKP
jgi:hypothetical protein